MARVAGILVGNLVGQRAVLRRNVFAVDFASGIEDLAKREGCQCARVGLVVALIADAVVQVGAESHLSPRENLLVDVQSEGIFVHLLVFKQTFVLGVNGRGVYLGLLRSARHRERVLLRGGRTTGNLVNPVDPFPGIVGVDIVLIAAQQRVGVLGIAAVLIFIGLAVIGGPFVACHSVLVFGLSTPAVVGIEVHLHTSYLSALGGDDDHAVGTCRTVDSRGRGILQHIDALDVVRTQALVASGQTVDDEQRLVVAIDGARTTQQKVHARTYLTRLFGDVEAGNLTLQGFHHIARRRDGDVFVLHADHRTSQVAFLHGSVTDDHNVVETYGIGFHRHLHVVFGSHDKRFVTRVGQFQFRTVVGHAQSEESV